MQSTLRLLHAIGGGRAESGESVVESGRNRSREVIHLFLIHSLNGHSATFILYLFLNIFIRFCAFSSLLVKRGGVNKIRLTGGNGSHMLANYDHFLAA